MIRGQHRLFILVVLVIAGMTGCQTMPTDDEGSTGRMGEVSNARQEAASIYIQLAAEYMRQGQYSPALLNARKAVVVAPSDSGAHNMLALIHQQLGEVEQAEKHFVEAVKLDPRDPYANNAFGSFLCGQKRYEQARRYFDSAVANPLNPEPWAPLTNGGLCAYEQGKMDVAEDYFRRALQTNPKVASALLRMGEISFNKANYLSARAYLQRYLEVAPHNADSLWLGIRTERQLGNTDQVASYELLLRSKFPDSEPLRYLKESR